MQRKCCKHQSKCQGKCLLWPGMAMRSSPGLDTQTQALGLTLPPGDHRTWSDTALIWALEDSPPPPRFLPQAAYSRSSEPPHADLLSKPEPTQGEVGAGAGQRLERSHRAKHIQSWPPHSPTLHSSSEVGNCRGEKGALSGDWEGKVPYLQQPNRSGLG